MKVTVVGAGGNVGSTVAHAVAQRDFAKEVVAVDLRPVGVFSYSPF